MWAKTLFSVSESRSIHWGIRLVHSDKTELTLTLYRFASPHGPTISSLIDWFAFVQILGLRHCAAATITSVVILSFHENRQQLFSLVDHGIGARIASQVDLAGTRDFLLGVEQHLFPLGDPAAGARDREQDREHRDREAHGLID